MIQSFQQTNLILPIIKEWKAGKLEFGDLITIE